MGDVTLLEVGATALSAFWYSCLGGDPDWPEFEPNPDDQMPVASVLLGVGLDPDMTIGELRRRLAIASRVDACVSGPQWLNATELLAHLRNGEI